MIQQLSGQQLWTLDKLGIPVWQLRQNPQPDLLVKTSSPEEPSSAKSAINQADFNADSQFLICYPATSIPAEQQLLANIIKAISDLGMSIEQCDLSLLIELSADKRPLPRQVLIFGEVPVGALTELQNRCFLLPSLADLIAEPARKAVVWDAICQFPQQVI